MFYAFLHPDHFYLGLDCFCDDLGEGVGFAEDYGDVNFSRYFEQVGVGFFAEDFLCEIVTRVLEERASELALLDRDIAPLQKVQKPFPRLSYDAAIDILKEEGRDTAWGEDFGAEDETVLANRFDRPVIVHRYPAECKAFYMKRDPENPKLALCMDVLAPEGYGEIIGGGEREDDGDVLIEAIAKHQLPQEAFEWFLDLRRFGSVPHAGFGLGLERTVTWICGLHHLRETIPFPRMLDRLSP